MANPGKSVRFDDDTMAAIEAEARAIGTNPSEWIRQAAVMRLAMTATARAVRQGATPDELIDPDEFIRRMLRAGES